MRARRFSVRLLRLLAALGQDGALPERVLEQIAAAGTGIGSNLSEAASLLSRKQMAQCYTVALREARESAYWLAVLHDLERGDREEVTWLLTEAQEFVAILTVSVRHLRQPPVQL